MGIDVPMEVDKYKANFHLKVVKNEIIAPISRRLKCVFWGVGNFNVTNVKGDRFGGTKPGKYGVD